MLFFILRIFFTFKMIFQSNYILKATWIFTTQHVMPPEFSRSLSAYPANCGIQREAEKREIKYMNKQLFST